MGTIMSLKERLQKMRSGIPCQHPSQYPRFSPADQRSGSRLHRSHDTHHEHEQRYEHHDKHEESSTDSRFSAIAR